MIKTGSQSPSITVFMEVCGEIDFSNPPRPIAVFFFPKAFTKGCSNEMNALKNAYEAFASANCLVVGISRDSQTKLAQFKATLNLPFSLLSDHDGSIAQAFNVGLLNGLLPVSKRATFVIDRNGVIRLAFQNMFQEKIHIQKALKMLGEIGSEV